MTAVSIHQKASLAADFAAGTPWPLLTGYGHDHELMLDGVGLVGLAQEYGTPLQVISESEVREPAAKYVRALREGDVAYASKAFLSSIVVDSRTEISQLAALGHSGDGHRRQKAKPATSWCRTPSFRRTSGPGDLLVMLCTGAYQHSMASNYNMVRRPPVVAVRGGRTQALIRRETDDDLMRRDLGLTANSPHQTRESGNYVDYSIID